MSKLRIPTIVLVVVVSLMNLPIGFDNGDINTGLAWAITGLGVLGLVAAVALTLRKPWGMSAVLGIGALNLVGAFIALGADVDGAALGIILSAGLVGLSLASVILSERDPARSIEPGRV